MKAIFQEGSKKKCQLFFGCFKFYLLQKRKKPVVLIDDISSELDETKIKSYLDFLTEIKVQIFMTDIGNKKLPLAIKSLLLLI